MPKLNVSVVTSIVADIRELVRVANEIYSRVGKLELSSWRYPTRSAASVDALELLEAHQGTAGELYILLLETAYDRMHFVARLIVEFLDASPHAEGNLLRETKNAERPGFVTLGRVIRLVWDRLKTIPESVSRNLSRLKSQEVAAVTTTRGTQAESNLKCCESCSTAGRTVLELANRIDVVLRESNLTSTVAAQRERMKLEIFDKTQWAVMGDLVEAIDRDSRTILIASREAIEKGESTARACQEIAETLKSELRIKEEEAKASKTRNFNLSERLRNVTSELDESKDDLSKAQERNARLIARFDKLEEEKSLLADSCAMIQLQLIATAESKKELEKTVDHLREEIAAARGVRLSLVESKNESDAIKSRLSERIEILERELVESRISDRSHLRPVDDPEETFLTPEDDPEADMQRQLTSNRGKIDDLLRQNERLTKTLNRLREYRRSGDTKNARGPI